MIGKAALVAPMMVGALLVAAPADAASARRGQAGPYDLNAGGRAPNASAATPSFDSLSQQICYSTRINTSGAEPYRIQLQVSAGVLYQTVWNSPYTTGATSGCSPWHYKHGQFRGRLSSCTTACPNVTARFWLYWN
ncbi:hypothetical protein SMC26_16620 [Actinomadura fulvescens]|uniref:Uncharacterized protein n=1 Tax=Actinomadura fulvescens TaxID=46160 RepID=A0ABP6BUZ8_9ACTN